jgi:hypothetical protein
MKATLLSIAFCLGIITLPAQITITSADMPSPGDSVRVSYATSTNSIDHTLTGPNYFWDFSTLIPNAQAELRFPAPTAIPFNFISTIAVINPSPDSLPFIGSVPNNFTNYYKNGSSGYRANGLSFEYAPLGNFTVPVIYSSSDYIYRFPLNYTDMDTSTGAYSFNIPNLAYIGETIHRESNVDGWGTVVTPYGSFQCIRMVSIVSITDTIGLDSVNGFAIPRPVQMEYKWMANGMKIPVLEVDAQILLSNEVVSNVIYQDSLRDTLFQVDVPELQNISGTQVFPNPASGNCTVSYQVANSGQVDMYMIDLAGRRVKTITNGYQSAGEHLQQVNLQGLNSGMYFLQIISGTSAVTKKIVINN